MNDVTILKYFVTLTILKLLTFDPINP